MEIFKNRVAAIEQSIESRIEQPTRPDIVPTLIQKVKTRLTTFEATNDFISFVNDSYFLLYPKTAEQEIAIKERKKPIGRIMIVWLITAYLWFIFGLSGYVAYYDDAVIYSKYGSPFYFVGKTQTIMTFFMIFILIPAVAKIALPLKERKDELFVKDIYLMLFDGSNGGLNDRNAKRMAWRLALIADIMCRIGPTAIGLGYGSMHTLLSVYAMIDDQLDESVIPYIMTGISYSLMAWYMTRIYLTGFIAFYFT